MGALTKDELELQEKREESLFIQKNSIEKTQREAREEGLEEGKKLDKDKKAIEVAKISIAQGLDTEIIELLTGLSSKEIESLR